MNAISSFITGRKTSWVTLLIGLIFAILAFGPLADIVAVELLLIVTGALTVLIAVIAVLVPSGKKAIAAAHAATGPAIKPEA